MARSSESKNRKSKQAPSSERKSDKSQEQFDISDSVVDALFFPDETEHVEALEAALRIDDREAKPESGRHDPAPQETPAEPHHSSEGEPIDLPSLSEVLGDENEPTPVFEVEESEMTDQQIVEDQASPIVDESDEAVQTEEITATQPQVASSETSKPEPVETPVEQEPVRPEVLDEKEEIVSDEQPEPFEASDEILEDQEADEDVLTEEITATQPHVEPAETSEPEPAQTPVEQDPARSEVLDEEEEIVSEEQPEPYVASDEILEDQEADESTLTGEIDPTQPPARSAAKDEFVSRNAESHDSEETLPPPFQLPEAEEPVSAPEYPTQDAHQAMPKDAKEESTDETLEPRPQTPEPGPPGPERQPPVDRRQSLLEQAIWDYTEQNYEEAILKFKNMLKLEPNFFEAYGMLGAAYLRNGMVSEAIECYENLAELDPNGTQAQESLAWIYANSGRLESALQQWQALLKLDPGRTDIQDKLDRANAALNRKNVGQQNGHKTESAASLGAGVQYFKRQDFVAASQVFESLLAEDSTSKQMLKYLGNACFRSNRLEEAGKAYARVLEIDANDVSALESLGLIKKCVGQAAEAARLYERILQLAPDRLDVQKKLADLQNVTR